MKREELIRVTKVGERIEIHIDCNEVVFMRAMVEIINAMDENSSWDAKVELLTSAKNLFDTMRRN